MMNVVMYCSNNEIEMMNVLWPSSSSIYHLISPHYFLFHCFGVRLCGVVAHTQLGTLTTWFTTEMHSHRRIREVIDVIVFVLVLTLGRTPASVPLSLKRERNSGDTHEVFDK